MNRVEKREGIEAKGSEDKEGNLTLDNLITMDGFDKGEMTEKAWMNAV